MLLPGTPPWHNPALQRPLAWESGLDMGGPRSLEACCSSLRIRPLPQAFRNDDGAGGFFQLRDNNLYRGWLLHLRRRWINMYDARRTLQLPLW